MHNHMVQLMIELRLNFSLSLSFYFHIISSCIVCQWHKMQHFIPNHWPLRLFLYILFTLAVFTPKSSTASMQANLIPVAIEFGLLKISLFPLIRIRTGVQHYMQTTILFDRKNGNCKLKPTNNKSALNPFSFCKRLIEIFRVFSAIYQKNIENEMNKAIGCECGIGGGNNNNRRCNVTIATNVICIVHIGIGAASINHWPLLFPNLPFFTASSAHRTLFTVRQHKSLV